MGLLQRYDPPAFLPDFNAIPGQLDQWHTFVSACFDGTIASEASTLEMALDQTGTVQYYNAATFDPGGGLIEQAIPWNAFPKELLRAYGRERALREADRLLPLSAYSPRFKDPVFSRYFYRPQNEYCEWHVSRDPETGQIRRISFSSEPPEYWQALFGDTVFDTAGTTHKFTGDQARLLQLYREWVSPDVQIEDLIATEDIATADGNSVLVAKGGYNFYNKWNTTHGIVHLCAPPNSLTAEIQLGGDATVVRHDRRERLLVEPEALICCAAYGGPDRNSDPTIGATVNALARVGALITLRNPVGLYMDHVDLTGWTTPDGSRPEEWVRIERGTPGMIERMVVAPPDGSAYSVSDLTIGGEPVQYGGQIAECITVKLVGIGAQVGAAQVTPIPCSAACLIDPAFAVKVGRSQPLDTTPAAGSVIAYPGEGLEEKGIVGAAGAVALESLEVAVPAFAKQLAHPNQPDLLRKGGVHHRAP